MATSFFVSMYLQVYRGMNNDDPLQFAYIVIITVACSTAIWLAATLFTSPEKEDVLLAFYRRVRPSAALWGPVARKANDVIPRHDGACNLFDWICGCVLVYMTLFGVGKLIFGHPGAGLGFLVLAAFAGWLIYRDLSRRGWKTVID